MPTNTQRDITKLLVSRLASVVDEEEACHTNVCENMIELATAERGSTGVDTVSDLISSLQYFDRLQQRTHYFAKTIECSLNTDGSAVELKRALAECAACAPHKDDADWCRQQAATMITGVSGDGDS